MSEPAPGNAPGPGARADGPAVPGPSEETTRRSSRGRGWAVVLCLVLAGLLTVPAAVAFWGQRTLNDTQRYVETVQPLVNSPEVQDVIVSKVTSAIEQQVDVEALLNDVFADVITDRPRLQQLTGVLAGAVNAQIERVTRNVVESPTFADLWTRANTRAQQGLQRALTGDGSGVVALRGDQIVLDLDEVIAEVGQRLVDRGVPVVSRVPVPETDRQIVLVQAPQLQDLRTIYAFANPIAVWLLPVVGLLYLAAFVLARRRARMTAVVGALLAGNALLLVLALSIGRQLFVNQLAGTAFGPASTVFYDTLLAYLLRGAQVLLVVGLVLVVIGWLTGSNRVGTSVRRGVAGGLENLGQAIGGTTGATVGAVGSWCAGNARWLRVVIGAVGIVVLFWGNNPSLPRLWWALALILVLLACLQVMIGTGRARPELAAPAVRET